MFKKGFTLIELLAVIVVLALILAIAVPSISKVIDNARVDSFKNQQNILKKAAHLYINSNPDTLPTTIGSTSFVKLSSLISNNITNILDPKDKSVCNVETSGVKITNLDGINYNYEPYLQCSNYKADQAAPGIETTINGSNLTVKTIEDSYLSFDGVSNYAYITTAVLTGFRTFEFTIFTRELLPYVSASWPNTQILHMNGSNTISTEFGIHNLSPNKMLIGFGAEGLTNYMSFNNYQLYNRYNVVYVMDDTVGNLYINGSLYTSAANMGFNTIGTFTPQTNLTLGAHTTSGCYNCDYYKMDLESLRVWQRPLTATEIANNYQNGTIQDSTNLVANYNFREVLNNIVYNKVSANYNCNLLGPTTFVNSGVKEIRVKQGSTLIASTTQKTYTFTLSAGTYTIEVEDYTGNINTKSVTI